MMSRPARPLETSVAIVGGGLAGLATALRLSERGLRVELFESRGRLGGRATSIREPATDQWIDNCQHVSMGCCSQFADFCRRASVDSYLETFDTLHFFGPDGRQYDMRAASWLPAPLHLGPALWGLRYLTWRERLGVARGLLQLARWRPSGGGVGVDRSDAAVPAVETTATEPTATEPTAGAWLQANGQSEAAIRRFWSVVIVSALAESVDRVALSAVRQVFVEGFMRARHGYEIHVPRGTLGDFYQRVAECLADRGVTIRLSTPVDRLTHVDGRVTGVRLKDSTAREFDFVVLAVAWRQIASLLPEPLVDRLPGVRQAEQLVSSPITSIHLWFDRPLTELTHAVLVERLSQWVFHRSNNTDDARREFYYQVVISASHELLGRDRESVVVEVLDDLRSIWPVAREAQLRRWQIISERHAVFSPTPDAERLRPPQRTPIPNLMLAGDWTRTGWPATMEGAVRSGYAAAEAIAGMQSDSNTVAAHALSEVAHVPPRHGESK